MSIEVICRTALSENVLVANGVAFFPRQQGYPAMRLNFSDSSAEIEQGISILGRLLKDSLTRGIRSTMQITNIGSNYCNTA